MLPGRSRSTVDRGPAEGTKNKKEDVKGPTLINLLQLQLTSLIPVRFVYGLKNIAIDLCAMIRSRAFRKRIPCTHATSFGSSLTQKMVRVLRINEKDVSQVSLGGKKVGNKRCNNFLRKNAQLQTVSTNQKCTLTVTRTYFCCPIGARTRWTGAPRPGRRRTLPKRGPCWVCSTGPRRNREPRTVPAR